MLITTGNYTPSSEYPTVKQISLGPRLNLKNVVNVSEVINKEFDFRRMAMFHKFSVKTYSDTFKKYKNAAKNYNIDLFFCDTLLNDACLDVAHALKKPVVGFSSFLSGNYSKVQEFLLKKKETY